MKRLLTIAGLAVAVSAGAYAQGAFESPSNEPVQRGGVYYASFCGTDTKTAAPWVGGSGTFYLRVTRELNRGWVEVDYSDYPGGLALPLDPVQNRPPQTARINLNLLCFVKPITP